LQSEEVEATNELFAVASKLLTSPKHFISALCTLKQNKAEKLARNAAIKEIVFNDLVACHRVDGSVISKLTSVLANLVPGAGMALDLTGHAMTDEVKGLAGQMLLVNAAAIMGKVTSVRTDLYSVSNETGALDLGNRRLQLADVALLSGCALLFSSSLLSLDISGNKDLGPESAVLIAQVLESHATLSSLNVSDTKTMLGKNHGLPALLSGALQKNRALTRIVFGGDFYTDYIKASACHGLNFDVGSVVEYAGSWYSVSEGVDEDGDVKLKSQPAVLSTGMTEADISRMHLRAPGAMVVAAFVPRCKAMAVLNISNNFIRADGARAMATALSTEGCILVDLDVSNNQITCGEYAGGGDPLADSSYHEDFTGVLRLLGAVGTSASLRCFHVGCNAIAVSEMDRLMAPSAGTQQGCALEVLCAVPRVRSASSSITDLNVSGKCLGLEGALVLSSYLEVGNSVLSALDVSDNKLVCQSVSWITPNCCQGPSFNQGDQVKFNGSTMVISEVYSDGDVKLLDFRGVMALTGAISAHSSLTSLNMSGVVVGYNGEALHFAQHVAQTVLASRVLSTLSLAGNRMEAEGISRIATGLKQNRVLTALNISRNVSSGENAAFARHISKALDGNETLTNLHLGESSIPLGSMQPVLTSLRTFCCVPISELRSDTITELDVSAQHLGMEGARVLAGYLEHSGGALSSLTFGDHHRTSINQSQVTGTFEVGAAVMRGGRSYEVVSVADDGTGNLIVAPACCMCVTLNRGMTAAGLSGLQLGAYGAYMTAAFLPRCPALATLDLSANNIGGCRASSLEAMHKLASALRTSSSLAELIISDNALGHGTAKVLASAVRSSTCLRTLDVSNNKFTEMDPSQIENEDEDGDGEQADMAGVIELADAVKVNHALSKVTFSGESNSSKPATIDVTMVQADVTGKHLELPGALLVVALMPRWLNLSKLAFGDSKPAVLESMVLNADISNANLGASGGMIAAAFIEHRCTGLLALAFGDAHAGLSTYRDSMAVALQTGTTEVDFSGTNLDVGSASIFAAFLPQCKALVQLKFGVVSHKHKHKHALVLHSTGDTALGSQGWWRCDSDVGCRCSEAGAGNRYTCSQGCNFDLCESCVVECSAVLEAPALGAQDTDVDLSGRSIGVPEAIILAAFLPRCQALSSLNVANNPLAYNREKLTGKFEDMSGITALLLAIGAIPALRTFTFSGDLSSSQPATIETTSTAADFSGKELGLTGAAILAGFLHKCPNLVELNGEPYLRC
jgi:Ran GTPase-activating protein (RanGAP) involved in mRNA processing and transport